MQNSIVLITDNQKIAQQTLKKIVLLRNSDNFEVLPYENCFDEIKKRKSILVLYHLKPEEKESEKFLNLLQKLKQTKRNLVDSVISIDRNIGKSLTYQDLEDIFSLD